MCDLEIMADPSCKYGRSMFLVLVVALSGLLELGHPLLSIFPCSHVFIGLGPHFPETKGNQ